MSTTYADDDGGTRFADPSPVVERLNLQAYAASHEPLFTPADPSYTNAFAAYDLTRSFDFRDWPEAEGYAADTLFDGAVDVPESRIRVISERDGKLVHACFEKVDAPISSRNLGDIARAAQSAAPRFVWRVTYRLHDWEWCSCAHATLSLVGDGASATLYHENCGRFRASRTDGPIDEHVASLQFAPSDEIYNGYYPTIAGNDIAHYNENAEGMDAHRGGETLYGETGLDNQNRVIEAAQPIRGGTEIRGGRAEHRRLTKDLIAWDSGTQKMLDRHKAEAKAKRREKNTIALEKLLNRAPQTLFQV